MIAKDIRIAIIGAGPGGLTLARLLQNAGFSPVVYEKEKSALARSQGGSLDLHPATGLRAIQDAGLMDNFRAIARYEDQGLIISDKDGNILVEETEDGGRPEVDRRELRSLLLDAINPDKIRWGYGLKEVQPTEDGKYTLLFENGQRENIDLVVGADGAWSRVRPLLTALTPSYAGETYIELWIDDIDRQHPSVARLLGRGTFMAVQGEKGLVTQRNAQGHIRVYLILKDEEAAIKRLGLEDKSFEEVRQQLLDLYEGWNQKILEIIWACSGEFAVRSLYTLPVGHTWENRPGATLIGDAAHLMPPSAGQGVNQAMFDAVVLAEALGKYPTIKEATLAYEQEMFGRTKIWAAIAAEGLAKIVSKNAPASTLEYFRPFVKSLQG